MDTIWTCCALVRLPGQLTASSPHHGSASCSIVDGGLTKAAITLDIPLWACRCTPCITAQQCCNMVIDTALEVRQWVWPSSEHAAGDPGEKKKKVWVIARQHPGESMAGGVLACQTQSKQGWLHTPKLDTIASAVLLRTDLLWPFPAHHTYHCSQALPVPRLA